MGSIEVLEVPQPDLPGGSGGGHGRISQGAALSQRQDARWQTNFAHRNRDAVTGLPNPAEQADAVCNGAGVSCNFDRIHLGMRGQMSRKFELRGSVEVMYGEHDTTRDGIF